MFPATGLAGVNVKPWSGEAVIMSQKISSVNIMGGMKNHGFHKKIEQHNSFQH